MAYTKNNLQIDIGNLNKTLAEHGVTQYLRASARYNYIGVDIYDSNGGCLRNLAIGKPRDLRGEAYEWAFWKLSEAVKNDS